MTLALDALTLTRGDFELRADTTLSAPVTALIGPSGSGKSTLLDAIAGFSAPHSGRILWRGTDITDAPPHKRPVALLFQDHNLFPHLDLTANLALALTTGRPDAAQRRQIGAALERVKLAGMEKRRPADLSGGQQSRAALARVLLQDRPLVLLDEPFAALGPGLKAEMLDLVTTVLKDSGKALILVTHDPDDARRIADETALLTGGRLTPPRPTAALFADPPEALRAYLGG